MSFFEKTNKRKTDKQMEVLDSTRKSRSLPLPEFKNLVNKKLKLGHKRPEGTTLGLSQKELN